MPRSHKRRRTGNSPDRLPNALRNVQKTFADALRHHQAGRIDDAVALYLRALALKPDYAAAHNNLGLALAAQGRIDEAVRHYIRALVLSPGHAGAHYNLGAAFAAQGDPTQAIVHYERALAINPDHIEAHNNLGMILNEQGMCDDAAAHFRRALILSPDHPVIHNNLGIALVGLGRIDDAVAHYERALILHPEYAHAHGNLGLALASQGRVDDAIAHYEWALILEPEYAHAHSNLGLALASQDRVDEAIAHYERALAITPGHAEAHNNLASLFKDLGKFDDAAAHYGRAIAIRPDYAEAHLNRTEIKTFHRGDADLADLEALAGRDDLSANKKLYFDFALAKALEDSGDYLRAFEHLRKGNALKRRQVNYDETRTIQFFRRISAVFDSSLLARLQSEGDPSYVPIFVVGMPRSGSTLIEQILAGHPQIHGGGELKDLEIAAGSVLNTRDRTVQYPECMSDVDGARLRRIARSYLSRLPVPGDGKIRITDKMPGNFRNIGLIRLILPNARIVHTMRNPIDTCVSCYSRLFTSGVEFSYDLAELGRYFRSYSGLMTHWRSILPPDAMLDVSYEDVVNDLEGQARRLVDYCGLPWDDRCIGFHRNDRPVKTASAVQVRKPLFRTSLQRWRRHEADLAPLLHELRDVIPSGASV